MLATFAALAWLTACQRQPIPALIEVTSLAPRDVEAGERLEIRGRGFPQGKPAHVRFLGRAHRAGEPAREVELEVEGAVTSGDRIELEATESFIEAFAGRDEDALHATFRGVVEVGFASKTPGAPPLVGALDDVAFDVRPARSSVEATRTDEGAQILSFLGVTSSSSRGVTVDALAPGSLAERSGVRVGDALAEVDGVHVLSVADVVPAATRAMHVVLLRGEGAERVERTIVLTGFRSSRFPMEYVAAVGLVALSLAFLAFFVLPPPLRLRAFEARLVAYLWQRRERRASLAYLSGGRSIHLAYLFASLLVGLLAVAPVLGNLDGIVLFVASSLLWLVAHVRAARGFVASLSSMATTLAGIALAALSVASTIVLRGGLSLGEVSRTQGFFPWQMAAMQRPTDTVFALLYLVALAFLLRPVGDAVDDAIAFDVDAPAPSARKPPADSVLLERLALFFASALGVAMFFGGWELPGATDGVRSFADRAVGALVFVGKTWALSASLSLAASLVAPWSPRKALSFALRRLLPLFAFGVLVVFVGLRVTPSATLRTTWTCALAVVVGLVGLRSALRIRGEARRPPSHASPFL